MEGFVCVCVCQYLRAEFFLFFCNNCQHLEAQYSLNRRQSPEKECGFSVNLTLKAIVRKVEKM